jgi:HAMP domain-containing protein
MTMRTKWMIRHPIQTKYLLIVILAMAAPTLVIGLCFYFVVFHLLAMQMAFPEAIMANLVPVIERVNWLLAISLPVLAAIILWIALAISHRFAGPVERLESDLDRVLAGDYGHRIETRKKDDLNGIVNRINTLLGQMKK